MDRRCALLISLLASCTGTVPYECLSHDECGPCGACQNGACVEARCDTPDADVPAARDADLDASADVADTGVDTFDGETRDTGDGPPRLRIEPEELRFGDVPSGARVERALAMENDGAGAATGLVAELRGPDRGEFQLRSECGAVLRPSERCTIFVELSPRSVGREKAATLVITSNARVVLTRLVGSGVERARLGAVHASKYLWAGLGATVSTSITIVDEGVSETGAVTAELSGPDVSSFAITGGSCLLPGVSLAGAASCEVRASFAAARTGAHEALLTVRSEHGGEVTVTLRADGVPRVPFTALPSILDAGEVAVGASSEWMYYELEVDPSNPPSSLNYLIDGVDADEFSLVPNSCNGGQRTCPQGIEFHPTGSGPKVATLIVSYPGGSTMIALFGTGVAAQPLAFSPGTARLATETTSTTDLAVELVHTATTATGPLAVQLSGAPELEVLRDDCAGVSLAPNGTCGLLLGFRPSRAGEAHARLTVSSPSIEASLPIAGIATEPSGTISVIVSGAGSVTGPGVSCPDDCTETTALRGLLTYVAVPEPNHRFGGWSGDCAGPNPCRVSATSSPRITAHFAPIERGLTLTALSSPGASGVITSRPAAIACEGECRAEFDHGARVELVAEPSAGSTFAGWSGDCVGRGRTCSVTMTSTRAVVAAFTTPSALFVSSSTATPELLTDRVAADAECQRLAAESGRAGEFVAWLSSGDEGPLERLTAFEPEPRGWVRADGLPFADTLADLALGRVLYPPRFDERGVPVNRARVATGAAGDGNASADCTRAGQITWGDATAGSVMWTETGTTSCADAAVRLYCLGIGRAGDLEVSRRTDLKTAFLSSVAWDPSSGLDAADALCQTEANFAGLLGRFRALLATPTGSPFARLGESAGYARADGLPLVEGVITEAHLETALTVHADGRAHEGAVRVWTGATALPTASGTRATTCDGWTTSAGSARGNMGRAGVTSAEWLLDAEAPCDTPGRVYCFEY
ncbi:choice-of-anchor D domain-containing protein [Myxococcota bacterium]|nr:choice-of-anchor D domain-containing protein [Myxococcota bacterium]